MDKEQTAIERLRTASEMSIKHYGTPLVVTTSGGKDSAVCIALAERAGIPFEAMHNHTTIDAPETVRFVREDFRRLEEKGVKCTVNFPVYKGQRVTMWSLIPQMLMPPTRLFRYCCSVLKERGGRGRFITTGVRWAESVKRKNNRGIYETMPSDPKKKIILNNDNDDRRRLWFGYNVQKMTSIAASMATLAFNDAFFEASEKWGCRMIPSWTMSGTDDDVDPAVSALAQKYLEKRGRALFNRFFR